MAKCVVHLKKIGGMGLGGVRNHMNRTGTSRTNPDIDKERSGSNYSPAGFSDASHLERRINARIKELNLKKAVRKDAVRLVDIVVTSSRAGMEAMGEDGKRRFFADAAAFLARRFGETNVMYANVHRDEAVDHMHFGFVPITADGRLAAKSILTCTSLKSLQTDFWREVGKKYGLERGEPALTPKEHIETERHKAEHAKNEATQAKKEATQAEERARAAQEISDEKEAAIERAANAQKRVEGVRAQRHSPFLGNPYYKLTTADYDTLQQVAAGGAAAIEEHLAMEAAVKRAETRARAAQEGMKLAQSGQRAAERRVEHVVQERDDLRREAAPYLNAPEVARPLAKQGIAWARDAFRATWDTVMRFMARAGVLRGEKARDVATRYAQPMKELGMEQGAAIPRAAAKAMTKQIRGRAPQEQRGAGWVVPPEAVDYLAKDAPDEVVAAVLSPAALRALDENIEDGVTWDMMTELEKDELKHRQLGREI